MRMASTNALVSSVLARAGAVIRGRRSCTANGPDVSAVTASAVAPSAGTGMNSTAPLKVTTIASLTVTTST